MKLKFLSADTMPRSWFSRVVLTMRCITSMFVVALLVIEPCQQASAEPIGLGAIEDLVGNDLISKAKSAGQDLLEDFNQKANLLSARLSDQLTVAAETAVLLAGNELDKQVKNMSAPIQQLMVNLNQLTDAVNGLKAEAFPLKDAIVVDIRALTQNVPFVGEKFYIQRVDGVLQLQKDSPYTLNLLAVGVGPATPRHRSTVGIAIGTGANKKLLTDATIDQIQANTAGITIPQSDLNTFFDQSKPVRLDASLEFDMQEKGLLGWKAPEHYSIPFGLTLMPINAGTISVAVRVHSYDWADTGNRDQKFLTTAELNGSGRYDYYTLDLKVAGTGHTPPAVGDQKYRTTDIKFDCISGQDQSCAFRDIFYIQPVDSDRTVEAYWRTNSHPTTWRLSADIMQWGQTGDKDQDPFQLPIQFGKNLLITVPNDYELIHITGKTITGEPIDVIYPNGSDLLKPLSVQPGSNTIIYLVNRPDGAN